jgi:hypothetical protein
MAEGLVDRRGQRHHQERDHADDRVVEVDRQVPAGDQADRDRDHDPDREGHRGQAVREGLGQAVDAGGIADRAGVAAVATGGRQVAHHRPGLEVGAQAHAAHARAAAAGR